MTTELKTFDVPGMAIFEPGEYKEGTITDADVDRAIRDTEEVAATGREPFLQLGHTSDGEGRSHLPRFGKVRKMALKAGKWVADFVGVPEELRDELKAGYYPKVSVELKQNYRDDKTGKVYPWILDRVALIGQAHQRVKGTSDVADKLAVLYASEDNSGLPGESVVIFTEAEWPEIEERNAMKDEEKGLLDKLKTLLAKVSAGDQLDDDDQADDKKKAAVGASDELKQQLADAVARAEKAEGEGKTAKEAADAEIAKLTKSLEEATTRETDHTTRIEALEVDTKKAVADKAFDDLVGQGRLDPKTREFVTAEMMEKMDRAGTVEFGEGDAAKKLTHFQRYIKHLESGPVVHEFKEIAGGADKDDSDEAPMTESAHKAELAAKKKEEKAKE